MKISALTALLSAATILSACSGGTIYKKDSFGELKVLSVDARQRLVLQGKVEGETVVCAEPSPDAIVAQAAELAASAKVPLQNSQNAEGQLAGGFSEAAASIAMRTQTIQLLRDGYYRMCEARLNNVLTKDQYRVIIAFIDEFITTVAAIEAIGGIVTTSPVAISPDAKATAGQNSVDVSGGGTAPVIPDITIHQNKIDKQAAEAVQAILANYYKRKAEYHAQVEMAYSQSGH